MPFSARHIARLFLIVALFWVVGCAPPTPTLIPRPLSRSTSAVVKAPTPRPTATPMGVAYGPVEPTKGSTLTSASPTTALRANPATATPRPTTKAKAPVPPKAGDEAYDFSLDDLQGKRVALSDWRGKKVMLNFWATWCGPCQIEIPHMVKLYDEYHAQGFEIVAVNLREDAAKVTPFVERFKMRFPILMDRTGQMGDAYFVRGIPTSVFLDEQGIIQAVHVGSLTEQTLRQYVDALMK